MSARSGSRTSAPCGRRPLLDRPHAPRPRIHGKGDDGFFAREGNIDAARELVATLGRDRAELFVYPGDEHLFVDSSLPTYDADAAALVLQRTLHFLSVV